MFCHRDSVPLIFSLILAWKRGDLKTRVVRKSQNTCAESDRVAGELSRAALAVALRSSRFALFLAKPPLRRATCKKRGTLLN